MNNGATIERNRAYGRFVATVKTATGEVIGTGMTARQAEYRARRKAAELQDAPRPVPAPVPCPQPRQEGFRPCRVHLAAPVTAHMVEGVGRLRDGWLDFLRDGQEPLADVTFESYPPQRVMRVEWLREEQEPPAGLEFFDE